MKKFIFFIVFLTLVGAGFKTAIHFYMNKSLEVSAPTIIDVPKGASLTRVATDLSSLRIILYPRIFVKLGQFYGYDSRIKYGEYQIIPGQSYRDLYEKLVSGENFKYEITHVEGDHIYDLAEQLEVLGLVGKKEFLSHVKDRSFAFKILGEKVPSLEGYLFPETYHFAKNEGLEVIVKTMVKKFLHEMEEIEPQSVKLSRHELVTLASIIEKETGAGFERRRISSVFHNRLKKGMRLQTDPTIIYGILNDTGREIKNIRKSDILRPTAYNTYVIKGLPPGPIGNPGWAALKAAADPEATQFLYFVSQNDGTHIFTENYKSHLEAVKKFQMNPNMRKGKSWRDLKDKKVQ